MRLPKNFVKLPFTVDQARLAEEIGQFDEGEWRAHPQRFAGNSSLVFVSTDGEENDDFKGPMMPTDRLQKAPYIRQIMASLDTVIGRSRLMRLTPGAAVSQHVDTHYFWRDHLRIHIPIHTEPSVAFYCQDEEVHMAAGEVWTFNNWLNHRVENRADSTRIHLVIDTVGSAKLWRMIEGRDTEPQHIEFDEKSDPTLQFENYRGMPVLPCSELRADLHELLDDLASHQVNDVAQSTRLRERTDDFLHDWHSHWLAFGPTAEGFPGFKGLLESFRREIHELPKTLLLGSNGGSFREAVLYTLDAALNSQNLVEVEDSSSAGASAAAQRPRFDRPVFIVAAPRSGSTLLFETLAVNRELWSVGDESHKHFESIPSLRPSEDNQSNRLTADMATADVVDTLLTSFAADLVDSDGKPLGRYPLVSRPSELRFLEKTPKNALRIPFILKAFPDARFIFLFRDARQNISSLIDSWRSGRYVTYGALPGWPQDNPWSHLLVPGWQKFIDRPLAEVIAHQWLVTNQTVLEDLAELPRERWCAVEYDALLAHTPQELQRLCLFSQIIFGPRMVEVAQRPLPHSKYTLTAPSPDKWKKNAREMEPVLSATEELMARMRSLVREGT